MNPSRRNVLASTGAAALAATVIPHVHAAENNTIDIALVGCGGRGTGAAVNALSTAGPTRLVAMADVFPDRLQASHKSLSAKFGTLACWKFAIATTRASLLSKQ